MKKDVKMPISLLFLLIIFCIGAGWGAGWYYEKGVAGQLEEMTRRGDVKKVLVNSVTLNVTAGGEDVGKTLTYAVTSTTRVQIGSAIVGGGDIDGSPVDVSKYIVPGDFVHLMIKDGQVVSLYRELRPGESLPKNWPI